MLSSKNVHLTSANSPAILNWLLAARPKTLAAAVAPVMVGSALAAHLHPETFERQLSVLCFLVAACIQVATNFLNDALDFKKGADSVRSFGPIRVTASGRLRPGQVMFAGFFFLFLALLAGIPLVAHRGWELLPLGIVSLALAYLYTGGPWPLAYRGLGDVFVILFFGVVATAGTFYVQSGELSLLIVVLGLQVGLLANNLLVINNARDAAEDREVGKMTLAARYGLNFCKALLAVQCLLVFVLLAWVQETLPTLKTLWIFFPLSYLLARSFARSTPSKIYNRYLAMAALLQLSYSIVLAYLLMRGTEF